MLRLTPRSITAAVLAFFIALFGVQHLIYFISSQATDANLDIIARLEQKVPLLPWVERTDFDMHLRYHRPGKIHPDVAIIEVNEKSIQELGQFPFPRSNYGKLIHNLEKYGAKVAAFDITFPEKERNRAREELVAARAEVLKSEGANSKAVPLIDARIQQQDGDDAFARALRESKLPVVLGFAFGAEEALTKGAKDITASHRELLKKHFIFRRQVSDNAFVHSMSGRIAILPHEDLIRSLQPGSSLGFFTAEPDPDSVIRRAVGVMGYEGTAFTSLAVRAVSSYLGVEPTVVGGNGLSIQDRNEEGKLYVPLSPLGSYVLRYYGGPNEFPLVEFSDVLSENPEIQKQVMEKVKGKIVFVGVTAVGLKDIRANPFSKDYPGVEVHATFASNMLTRSFLEMDQRYFLFGYAFIIALGIIVGLLVYRLHPLWAFPLTMALIVAFQFMTQDAFFNEGIVVPTLLPSFACAMVLFAGVLYRYFTEEKEKRQVRTAFSRYVSGPVVEEILMDPSKLKLGGQKKVLTVMFCDLMGFTKLSENMDATQLTTLLNEYFTRMTTIILRNKGTLDKYMGDAIMCFWGAPLDIPEHARLACNAALEMTTELEKINQEWKEKYGLTIGLRIGLHTGEMNVGNMGSEQVFSYTVMGDNVNLGSRLEGVNNVYGTTVIASQATAATAGDSFFFRALDHVQVKGKEDAVQILELVCRAEAAAEHAEWVHAFEAGLESYRLGNWDEAKASFGTALSLRPQDMASKVFIERVEEMRLNPKRGWDGVWRMNSK